MENRVMCRLFIKSASQPAWKKVPTEPHTHKCHRECRTISELNNLAKPSHPKLHFIKCNSFSETCAGAARMPVEFIFQALIMACDNFLLFSSVEAWNNKRASGTRREFISPLICHLDAFFSPPDTNAYKLWPMSTQSYSIAHTWSSAVRFALRKELLSYDKR